MKSKKKITKHKLHIDAMRELMQGQPEHISSILQRVLENVKIVETSIKKPKKKQQTQGRPNEQTPMAGTSRVFG